MSLFSPSSIAVIGASATEGKVGHYILQNLVEQGFKGDVIPINPKHDSILGKDAFQNVNDISQSIDMAVVVTPAKTVPAVLDDCGKKGIQTVVIISAGFGEVHTDQGAQLEEEVSVRAKKYNMQLVGPNCLGVLRPGIGMNASFAKDLPSAGNIALVSQSGAMAVALMDASFHTHIGFSFVASIGNKTAMDETDFLELLAEDDETEVIGFYLESIKDGERFLEVAERLRNKKPIVLLKSGVSEQGRKAASSHTGSLAGSDAAIQAVCAQAGLHRANTAEELMDLLLAFSTQPPLLSRNIAVVTNAGGPGILATDAAEFAGLSLPELSSGNAEALKTELPAAASVQNPIDVLGDAVEDRYRAAIRACGDDPGIDGVAVLLTPQVMTPATTIADVVYEEMKELPLMPVATSFMGGKAVEEAASVLATHNIPNYETPARAISALAALLPEEEDSTAYLEQNDDRAQAAATLIGNQTGLLSEELTEALFTLYDLPLPRQQVAKTADEAVRIAQAIGYPVIAKVSSPQILHKTDVGGIAANLKNDEAVREAFASIMNSCTVHCPEANIRGVLIQQFLPIGNEFIIGSLKDPSFGPLIMVGLGGIYTELFRDTSFRMAPVTLKQAYTMLQDLKAWKLLLGMRGKGQSDIDTLATTIVQIAQLVHECPQISELDLNPVLVGEDGVVIADVKVVVS